MAKNSSNANGPAADSSSAAQGSSTGVGAATVAAASPGKSTAAGKNPAAENASVVIPVGKSAPVNLSTLMEAGAHFGHQTQRWNPKMMPYIYGARNGIHIINLDATVKAWKKAQDFIRGVAARGASIMFVGTKPQAREIVKAHAVRSNSYHVTERWLGGTLSNFQTVRRSIERMRKLEDLLVKAEDASSGVKLQKKEKLALSREIGKLSASLGGIREMRRLPEVLFVVDIVKEAIAIAEARKLQIPIVALVDTNTDPNKIDIAIPSNDDAARTINLFVSAVADSVLEGRKEFESRVSREDRERLEREAENAARAAERKLSAQAPREPAAEKGESSN